MVYEIKKDNIPVSVKMVGEPIPAGVNAQVTTVGSPIEVRLGSFAGKASQVSLTSLSGQTFYRSKVESVSESVSIPTSGLVPGTYVVSVASDIGSLETVKVILR